MRAYRIWNNARQRAARSGIPFDISFDWFLRRLNAGRCEATGIPLTLEVGSGSGRGHPFAPSLDQKVPGAGYTPDNTAVVCWLYNCAKGVTTHDNVVKMAKALVETEALREQLG